MDLVPKVKGFERTDLFGRELPSGPTRSRHHLSAGNKLAGLTWSRQDSLPEAQNRQRTKTRRNIAEGFTAGFAQWLKSAVGRVKIQIGLHPGGHRLFRREDIPVGQLPDEK